MPLTSACSWAMSVFISAISTLMPLTSACSWAMSAFISAISPLMPLTSLCSWAISPFMPLTSLCSWAMSVFISAISTLMPLTSLCSWAMSVFISAISPFISAISPSIRSRRLTTGTNSSRIISRKSCISSLVMFNTPLVRLLYPITRRETIGHFADYSGPALGVKWTKARPGGDQG